MKHRVVSARNRLVCAALTLLLAMPALAQQVQPGGPPPIVCVYNSSLPTLPSSGLFGYVQCDVHGQLLTSGGGGGGGGAITAPLGPTTAPSAAVAITDTGAPITGQTLGTGGQGLTGWLSQIDSHVNSSIPAGTNIIGKVGIDQTTPGTTNLVALAANQSVNEAQINGATVLTGAGVATGSQRVVAAQDITTIAGSAPGTAGTASPNVVTVQGIASGTNLNVNCAAGCAGSSGTFGPTAVGSPSANPPVQMGGTLDGTATGNVQMATVKPSSTAPLSTDTSLVVGINPNSLNPLGAAAAASSVPVIHTSQYPANAVTTSPTPAAAKSTGTTGAVTGTIAAVASATNYLCGFDVSYIGGTAGIGPVTVTGLLGGTWTYQLPLSSATSGNTFSKEFNMCVPASAVNVAISVVTTADATATAVDVQLHGYTE